MLTPAAAQTITSRLRCWGCFSRNVLRHIGNDTNKNNGCEESDDGVVSDDGSRGRVGL